MSNYNLILMQGAKYRETSEHMLKASETSAYTNVQLTNGVGKISSAGVEVQKGVKGTIKIDMTYSTFSSRAYEKCTEELKNTVTAEKYEKLKEYQKESNYKAWWFWLVSASEKEFYHDKDQTITTKNVEDEEVSRAIEKMFSEEKQDYHVEGTFEVEGQSNVPTKVQMFISTLNVQTDTQKGVSVIDTDSQPILLSPDGGEAKAEMKNKEKFQIVELS